MRQDDGTKKKKKLSLKNVQGKLQIQIQIQIQKKKKKKKRVLGMHDSAMEQGEKFEIQLWSPKKMTTEKMTKKRRSGDEHRSQWC